MRNKVLSAFMATALLGGAGVIITEEPAAAQSSTAGAVRGIIKDKATGEPLVGATVVATSTVLLGEQVVITDESGAYYVDNLPPGTYTITVIYAEAKFSRGNVIIQVGKQSLVNIPIDTGAGGGGAGGETIVIQGNAPIVDQGSTKTGVTFDENYTNNIPVGRTFGTVLNSTAGSQGDQYGIGFSGSTSAENTYIVEGINTTDTGFGLISLNLPNEFINETEVITGGYNAEFGRSTGGIINVVTKQGSNEFKGSVFAYYTPGALVAAAKDIDREGQAIDAKTDLDYALDVGGEIGGPIIKDKLWFHVGFNPNFSKSTTTRYVQSLVDANQDGVPDVDPETGFAQTTPVSESPWDNSYRTLYFTAKINGALSQNHQFQVAAFGNPRHAEDVFAVTRNPRDIRWQYDDGAYDVAGKWSSKFADGKTQVDAVVGFHRGFEDQRTLGAESDIPLVFYNYTRSLGDFASVEGEQEIAACQDGTANDMYPEIRNCPVLRYASQGLGFLEDRTNDRTSAVVALTQRVKLLGYHTFKGGLELELMTYNSNRRYTGGEYWRRSSNTASGAPGTWQLRQFLSVDHNLTADELAMVEAGTFDPGNPGPEDDGEYYLCGGDQALCRVARDGLTADTNNRNLGAYIQDSWQIRPNLTINAGVRWEQTTAYVAEALQGQPSPEGEIIPDVAFKLNNMIAPRVGVIYDPTQEGRSKLFAHWGRFYENVPMDINVRAFGGEITNYSTVNFPRVATNPNCNVDFGDATDDAAGGTGSSLVDRLRMCPSVSPLALLGDGTEYVQPGLKGQFLQELVVGAEYELRPDFKMGLNYVHRTLPIVIEDVSTDGGNTYLIANPGEDLTDQANDLREQGEALLMDGDDTNDALGDLYIARAQNLQQVGRFDKPQRNYDAVQVTATQRPTKRSLLIASYTYARSKGNYPGLFSTETGQLDPNLTSMYDLPDLMANRYGANGLDRPHLLKVDGFYQFDLKTAGLLTVGASFRTQSGIPHNVLAAHPTYQLNESYLLARGAGRRSPTTYQTDLHTSYGRRLGKDMTIEVFARIFNLFNQQEEVDSDETYTVDNVVPVVGGEQSDLPHAKVTDVFGYQLNETPNVNKNFGNTSTRQAPFQAQFGLRMTF